MVQPRTSVNDIVLDHFIATFGGTSLINPRRLLPVILGNEAKLHKRVGETGDATAERVDCG